MWQPSLKPVSLPSQPRSKPDGLERGRIAPATQLKTPIHNSNFNICLQ